MRTSPRLIPSILAVSIAAILASLVLTAGQSSGPSMTRVGGPLGSGARPVAAGPADAIPVSARQPAVATPPTGDAFDPTKVALSLSLVKSGFASPLLVTNAHDGSGRLFVVEQAGTIRVIDNTGTLRPTPLLDLRGRITTGGERGLLGLAFDPKFPTLPYIYVNFTDNHGNTAISRYTIGSDPNVAVWKSGIRILTIGQPYANHNGGNIAFGPDGYLYIGMGDGGSAGDPGNRAQNVNSLLGKMLRIDVHHGTRTRHYAIPSNNPYVGRAGLDEIWARGLRNPWRFSFDRVTGQLWIGDVGQNRYEEIDRSSKVGATPAGRAANYGWPIVEGRACYRPTRCSRGGTVAPVVVYAHAARIASNCAVTGGFAYHGSASPALRGGYVFGDFCSGRIWIIATQARGPLAPTLVRDPSASPRLAISSFGEDEAGELYVTDLSGGAVYRISATAKP